MLLIFFASAVGIFIYFKIVNKDDNLGFQDFIIDKMSGKKSSEGPSYKDSISSSVDIPLQKAKIPPLDVLADIAPSIQTSSQVPNIDEEITTVPQSPISVLPIEASVPDWLKASTTLSSQLNTEDTGVQSEVVPEETIPRESVPEEVDDKSPEEIQEKEQL